jgi:hypothetical protein
MAVTVIYFGRVATIPSLILLVRILYPRLSWRTLRTQWYTPGFFLGRLSGSYIVEMNDLGPPSIDIYGEGGGKDRSNACSTVVPEKQKTD